MSWLPDDLRDLDALQRRLRGASTVGELLARVCGEARSLAAFDRAIALGLEDGRLTASASAVLPDADSDALRRQVLREPVELTPRSAEASLMRHGDAWSDATHTSTSVLQDRLGLAEAALVAISPQSRPLALLVVDRAARPVDGDALDALRLLGHLSGLALELLVVHARMEEIATELRYFTASTQALVHEALRSPVGLQHDHGSGPVFPPLVATAEADSRPGHLSEREEAVVRLLVAGRSNRQIAEELNVSPETVKGYVARTLRKLGAANRVEAVARYLAMTG